MLDGLLGTTGVSTTLRLRFHSLRIMSNKIFGEKGIDLVKEASRSNFNLTPFNEDVVRQTIEETRALWESNRAEVEATGAISASVSLRHTGIDRNRRCLLAYLNSRMEKMREMRWQFGAVLPEEVKINMSEPELEYFSKYNKHLATYMRAVGTDLTSEMAPPKSLYVEVRVREDHGEVETADGEVVLLKAGSQHHLPRHLCEQLIMQGVLEHVTS